MSYPTCDHLKEDGVYCDSPALRGQNFCYFHFKARARRLQAASARLKGQTCRIQLPVLEDMHAVQASLMQVLDALADDRIDHKRAGLMLYALQQAATNLNCTPGWKGKREQVEPGQPLRALEAPDVAEQYDLPEGVGPNLPPEAALQAAEEQSDPPKEPKEHRRLARVPERAATQHDKYFHIPRDPGGELTFDEMAYTLSRMKAQLEEVRGIRRRRAPGRSAAPLHSTSSEWKHPRRSPERRMLTQPTAAQDFTCNSLAMRILRTKPGLTR